MLVDANLLLYAVHASSPFHTVAAAWLTEQLNGERRVGLPWESLVAFLRISTHPRAVTRPLTAVAAWAFVTDWLAADVAWIPEPTSSHGAVLARLITTHDLRGNVISDAQMAALAIEHGVAVASADTDFARFTEISWINPLARG
ncbi:MAG: TA system VapC family ribonuclease toxin [Candidatus Dormibacteria bacterium]